MTGSNPFTETKWVYDTPLEQPDGSFTLNPRVVSLNGMDFQARSDTYYRVDPYKIVDEIEKMRAMTPKQREKTPYKNELNLIRNMVLDDLWFIVYFIIKNPLANHPFIVEACQEVQSEKEDSQELWARDHFKTTIISVARSVQKILENSERRLAIFAAVRPLAIKIQNLIRKLFESPVLIACFPDVLYEDPKNEAPRWTDAPEGGLIVKRRGFYKEATISSWGLAEGMPTGDHYTDIVCDDIETPDQTSIEVTEKIMDNFEQLYLNIASSHGEGCHTTVVGTYYTHTGVLVKIGELTNPISGKKLFKVRKKPATVDGAYNGRPVFLKQAVWDKKRAGKKYMVYCQYLLDPTPRGEGKLRYSDINIVRRGQVPVNSVRVMTIDGAGDKGRRMDGRRSDRWCIGVYAIERGRDQDGLHDVYILDLWIKEAALSEAQRKIVEMVLRNGPVRMIGVEKVAMSTTEIHVSSALAAKGRHYSEERGNLIILSPGGRSKEYRIESALTIPLANSKIHMVESVPKEMQMQLQMEMEKFPAWKDDGLDGFSYVWDITSRPDFRFGYSFEDVGKKPEDKWDRALQRAKESRLTKDGYLEV